MNQLNFSDQSTAELNKLSPLDQMPIIDALTNISLDELKNDKSAYGAFVRGKQTYYRLRQGDLRIYFTAKEGEIFCCYILHKHSIADFAFRANLPVKDEHIVEQDKNFWDYLDSFNK